MKVTFSDKSTGDLLHASDINQIKQAINENDIEDITWGTISGKPAVIASGDTQQEAREAIGAGTSDLAIGTGSDQAMAGDTVILPPAAPVEVAVSETLTQADHGKTKYATAAVTITVRTNSLEPSQLGTTVNYVQAGEGAITFSAESGVTILSKNGALATGSVGDAATLIKLFANTWMLIIGG